MKYKLKHFVGNILGKKDPVRFDQAFHPYLRKTFSVAIAFYAITSTLYIVGTGLFEQPWRYSLPDHFDILCPIDKTHTQALSAKDPKDVIQINADGMLETVGDIARAVAHSYKEAIRVNRADQFTLVIAGLNASETLHVRELWNSLRKPMKENLSIDSDTEEWHVAGLSSASMALCGSELDTLWNGHRLPFSKDAHFTALRIRQALDMYFVPDAPVLVHAPVTQRLILWKGLDTLSCIKFVEPTIVDLADLGLLLVLPDDASVPDIKAYLVSAWRRLLGLPEPPICATADSTVACNPNLQVFVSAWEWQSLRARHCEHLRSLISEDLEKLASVQSTFWQHEWSEDGKQLLETMAESIELLENEGEKLDLSKMIKFKLIFSQLLSSSIFLRRPYLPPSFLGALYGPIVVLLTLPFTQLLRTLITKLKQRRQTQQLED